MKALQQIKVFTLMALALTLAGCVTLEETFTGSHVYSHEYAQYQGDECTSKVAFELGKRDAFRKHVMRHNYSQNCLYNKHRLNQAYIEGYKAGMASRGSARRRPYHASPYANPNRPRDPRAQQQRVGRMGQQQKSVARIGRPGIEQHEAATRIPSHENTHGNTLGRPQIASTPQPPAADRMGSQHSANMNTSNRGGNGWRCLTVNGRKVCGYNCVRSGNNAKCADTASKRCIANSTGKIACGFNCVRSIKSVRCAQSSAQNCVADSFGNIKCGTNCHKTHNGIQCG